MNILVPEKLHNFALGCDFPVYIVGGYVRDALAGLESGQTDIDICAPVSTEKFCTAALLFGAKIDAVYRNTGTVKLSLGEEKYEFSCFRSDEYVRGIHTPVKTFFTDDITLDALRRDFKCNAVYYDIKEEKICDPLGGVKDIEDKVMNTVADADKVFGEDGLRLMRLARQAAQLSFTPLSGCALGAKNNAKLIEDISAERIYCELDAILHADEKYGIEGAQYRGLKILDEIGVLDCILPELTLGRGMAQNPQFHKYDVLEHSLRCALYAQSDIRLAALLHDVGKPRAFKDNGNFYMHEQIGADVAQIILERLKAPKKVCEQVVRLTRLHMYDLKCDARENKIRLFIVKNYDIFESVLLIKQADYSACRDDLSVAPCVKKWKSIYEKMKSEGAPMTLKELAINGDDLKGIVPPQSIGKALNEFLCDCAIDCRLNNKKTLLIRAEKGVNSGKFI